MTASLVVGCGEVVSVNDGGDGSDASVSDAASPDAMKGPCEGPNIEFDDLVTCLLQVQCEFVVSCSGQFATVDECIAAVSSSIEGGSFRRYEDAIAAGRMSYDGAKAFECLNGFAQRIPTCEDDDIEGDACELVFVGQVSAGGTCFDEEECAIDNSQCYDPACGDAQCCAATCVSPAGIGEDCTSLECEAGAHCNSAAPVRVCVTGDVGAACASHSECDDENHCGPAGTCIADNTAGASCADDRECAAPTTCVGDDLSVGTGTCRRSNTTGDMCDNSCFGNLYCFSNNPGVDAGTCRPQPGIGDQCDFNGAYCSNSFCDYNLAIPTCQPLRTTNESCLNNARCDNDNYCDGSVCQLRGSAGASCDNYGQCMAGLFCTYEITGNPGMCSGPLADGAVCAYSEHCMSRECHDDPSIPGVRRCQTYQVCQ